MNRYTGLSDAELEAIASAVRTEQDDRTWQVILPVATHILATSGIETIWGVMIMMRHLLVRKIHDHLPQYDYNRIEQAIHRDLQDPNGTFSINTEGLIRLRSSAPAKMRPREKPCATCRRQNDLQACRCWWCGETV